MHIDRFDHVVLTVLDIEATCKFYERACGMQVETFGNGRKALKFGQQKINLHQVGKEIKPYAQHPTRGSADFCMITSVPVEDVMNHLKANGIAIEEGIVDRTGAMGPIRSVYIRDPDQNLVEISNYPDKAR
jgi:catechol 2,3-dioxygenase-like lactoylglutathione lyase family enzyme